jgi:hypothetical protein
LFLRVIDDVDGPAVDHEVPHAADEAQLEAGAPDDRRKPEELDFRVDAADKEWAGKVQRGSLAWSQIILLLNIEKLFLNRRNMLICRCRSHYMCTKASYYMCRFQITCVGTSL